MKSKELTVIRNLTKLLEGIVERANKGSHDINEFKRDFSVGMRRLVNSNLIESFKIDNLHVKYDRKCFDLFVFVDGFNEPFSFVLVSKFFVSCAWWNGETSVEI